MKIAEKQAELESLLVRVFGNKQRKTKPDVPAVVVPTEPATPIAPAANGAILAGGDQVLVDELIATNNKGRILYVHGDWRSAGFPSHSEARAALTSIVAWYVVHRGTGDAKQVERVYLASRLHALQPDKWGREREILLGSAIEKANESGAIDGDGSLTRPLENFDDPHKLARAFFRKRPTLIRYQGSYYES